MSQVHHLDEIVVSCFSLIIKTDSVARNFPGGLAEFERTYSPTKAGKLFRLIAMSTGDTEFLLEGLHDAGIIPGEDVGVCAMTDGPLLPCRGMIFESVGTEWPLQWKAKLVPDGGGSLMIH